MVSMVLMVTYVVLSLSFKVGYVDEVKERILAKILRKQFYVIGKLFFYVRSININESLQELKFNDK